MDYRDIVNGLKKFVDRYDSQTYLGSYRETSRSSLLNEGLSTRANSLWKMAEYVVARYDGRAEVEIQKYLKGWIELASNAHNQFLLLEEKPSEWGLYDSQGKKLGDEGYIKEYFDKKSNDDAHSFDTFGFFNSSKKQPYQLIYFGAPGTSKSTNIKRRIGDASQHRITFHPDTDYSNFVGCYKPTKKKGDENLTYAFVEQTFVKAYVEAWKKLVDKDCSDKRVFLVIEEINRGNCAQIFGDLFQLLDRNDNGYSDYTIEPDGDLQKHLEEVAFVGCTDIPEKIRKGVVMQLPPNLFIWATMNTSDQSLFPIDSAFKRRWDWKYTPIMNAEKGHVIALKDRQYDWWEFLDTINKRIEKVTESEDKQMGYWFAKPEDGIEISSDKFVSKVVFYLWNDVFKDYGHDPNSPFVIKMDDGKKTELRFKSFFDQNGDVDESVLVLFFWGLKLQTKAGASPVPSEENSQESLVNNDTYPNEPFTDVEEELPEATSIDDFFKQ